MTRLSNARAVWLSNAILPHEPALRRWLEGKRLRGVDIDDVVQETYAILIKRESVEDIHNPKAYFYKSAYSVVLMHLRRARVISIQAVADVDRLGPADDGPSPEQSAVDRDEFHRLAAALAQLPSRCREVFVLRKVHGLSQLEVAARMGVSEGTVEKQVQKGLAIVVDLLGRGGNTGRGASNADRTKEEGGASGHGQAGVQRRHRWRRGGLGRPA